MASTLADANNCCTPCESPTTVNIPGPQGAAGVAGADGTDGVTSFTTFTALFTIPAELATAVATVADTTWMVIGMKVYGSRVDGSVHAFFEVTAIGGPTSVTLKNLEDTATSAYTENSAPASTLIIGSMLITAGIQGPTGLLAGSAAGGDLKGTYPNPKIGIGNTKGSSLWGNGTDTVAVAAGTNGHMLAYDSTDAEGIKTFKALPLTGDTDLADNRIMRTDGATGLPVPGQPSKVEISDTGAIAAVGSAVGVLGNARGTDAIDLQVARTTNTMVASGARSFIGGGENNTASSTESIVVGGDSNVASTNSRAVVVGGMSNQATGQESFIGGGQNNTATGTQSAVCGGDANDATASEAFIGGGQQNTASAQETTVAGGVSNTASGAQSFVGGGSTNAASQTGAVIDGGFSNAASAPYSTVGGGYDNDASGDYSTIIGGKEATANKHGQVAHASGMFATAGDAQVSEFLVRNNTTDATPTELKLDGATAGSRMVIPNNTSWMFQIMLVARRSTGTTSIYKSEGQIENTGGAVTASAVTTTEINDGIGLPATPVTVAADDPNNALIITCTGVAANNIRWVAHVRVVEVSY